MFHAHDTGCHADGALGQDHVRARMAQILTVMYRHHPRGGDGIHWGEVGPIVAALGGPMSDDAGEEQDALMWLDSACDHSVRWMLDGGDLLLVLADGEEDDGDDGDDGDEFISEHFAHIRIGDDYGDE